MSNVSQSIQHLSQQHNSTWINLNLDKQYILYGGLAFMIGVIITVIVYFIIWDYEDDVKISNNINTELPITFVREYKNEIGADSNHGNIRVADGNIVMERWRKSYPDNNILQELISKMENELSNIISRHDTSKCFSDDKEFRESEACDDFIKSKCADVGILTLDGTMVEENMDEAELVKLITTASMAADDTTFAGPRKDSSGQNFTACNNAFNRCRQGSCKYINKLAWGALRTVIIDYLYNKDIRIPSDI